MPVTEVARGIRHAAGEYDFAVDGGAISTITMRSSPADPLGNDIPPNAVILGGYIEVDTAIVNGVGTIAINSEAAGDILAATAAAGFTVGRKTIIPVFTGATTVKTTVRRQLQATIAGAAVTAGKFRVVVIYMAATP